MQELISEGTRTDSTKDDETEIAALYALWKEGRSKRRASRYRPVGLITAGRFVFLHLVRTKRGEKIPKLVAKAELVVPAFRKERKRVPVGILLARGIAYAELSS